MKKTKLIIALANAILCIVLVITVAVAWYTNTTAVNDMSFQILQIDSLVTSYKANDKHFNGAPDYLSTENVDKYYSDELKGMIPYSNLYHHEYFSFNYIDQRYALTSDSSANLLDSIVINDLAPTKVYTFKFEITNYSGIENALDFTFDPHTYDSTYLTGLSNFEVRLGIVNSDNSFDFTSWNDMTEVEAETNDIVYNGFELDPTETGIVVPKESYDINDPTKHFNGRLDMWLQVRTKATCETAFTNFLMPEFRIRLAIEREVEES